MSNFRIPLDVRWPQLEKREQRAVIRTYKSARRVGYSINDARYMVNSIIDRCCHAVHVNEYKQLDLSDAPTVRRSGQDEALESWDDEPAWVQRVAGLTDDRNQLENGILIFCVLVVVYVIYHISLAILG